MLIGVVEDHEIVVEGVRAALAREPGWEVAVVAGNVAEFARTGGRVDVVVCDLGLPGPIEGIEAIRYLSGLGHRVVVLSARTDDATIARAIAAGAQAYVSKSEGPKALVAAVRAAVAGRTQEPPPAASGAALTPRQEQVLAGIARGLRNHEIAAELGLSLSTVKRHVEALMERTGRRTRAGLAGLTRPD